MSAALLGLAWAAKVGDSKTRKLVLMKLVDCCDDEGSNIYPALATVAEHVGCSTQQVRRELKRFCEVGLLRKVRDGGKGKGSTARYEMDIDMLARLRRADIWPVLEAAALHDPLPDTADDDEPGHAQDAGQEASSSASDTQSLGDMVSPLHGVRVTSDAAKGDSRCHPTPYLEPSLEREGAQGREGTPASEGEPERKPTATLDDFRRAYPHAGADDQAALASAWEAVPFAERQAAIDGIPGFVSERKAAGFSSRLSGPKYLSGFNWRHVPKQAAERAARQAAGAFCEVKGWSKDWWLVLLARIAAGQRVGFVVQQADAGKSISVAASELATAAKRIGELRSFLCDGPEIDAWRPWLAARGARIPVFEGNFRVFLPSEMPPSGRKDEGDDHVRF
ncbi:hypothetical protein GGC47_003160 [Bosea sp. OAE752]|uniref:helix-turn-helix domain-containing protein n=1 Tax=Bosea sp. OAE752 TaxID=2663873 RepID=UPI003D1EFE9B